MDIKHQERLDKVIAGKKQLDEAYQWFLDVCDVSANDETKTGVEASIALERVKIRSGKLAEIIYEVQHN